MTVNEYEVSFHSDKNVMRLDSGGGDLVLLCEYTKPQQIVHFKKAGPGVGGNYQGEGD